MSSEEAFECGSSLAEREHGGEDMPPPPAAARPQGRRDCDSELKHECDDSSRGFGSACHSDETAALSSTPNVSSASSTRPERSVNDKCDLISNAQRRSAEAAVVVPMPIPIPPIDLSSVSSLRWALGRDVIAPESLASPFENRHSHSSQASKPRQYLHQYQVPLVYCDQTASNRPLQSVEAYVGNVCLPLYGNTHTNTGVSGSQSTAFVSEARQLVAEMCNAKVAGKASLDVVLFAGHGTTSAVELLIDCLGLEHACREADSGIDSDVDDARRGRPVVFVGPYEHHSNLIPWRESGCEIVAVPECPETHQVDLTRLDEMLSDSQYDHRLKVGTFSAASNVTGKVCDTCAIAACLHRRGALAFFDYATAAPYVKVDMNPPPDPVLYPTPDLVAKDAVFFSPHKMLGGVGTPGVLVVKKSLVSQQNPPKRSGGGTVFYVSHTSHRFLSNRLERYEGGTPNVPGIVRTGLACLVKRQAEELYAKARDQRRQPQHVPNVENSAPPPTLEEHEYQTYESVAQYLQEHAPNLVLLGRHEHQNGPSPPKKLPIFSFLIRWGKRFLHYNYVCAVLNDVFGIQSRGGCQCSGPYSQFLLGLTETNDRGEQVPNQNNLDIERALLEYKERAELLRPGYTRLSLPFKGLLAEEVEYVKKALVWASRHAWELMCLYRCNHRTGEWRHMSRQGRPLGRTERRWLGHYSIDSSQPGAAGHFASRSPRADVRAALDQAWSNAEEILAAAREDRSSVMATLKLSEAENVLGADDVLERLRWYVYPQECASLLSKCIYCPPPLGSVAGALAPRELALQAQEDGSTDVSVVLPADDRTQGAEERQVERVAAPPVTTALGSVSTCIAMSKKATRDSTTWGKGRAVVNGGVAVNEHERGEADFGPVTSVIQKSLQPKPPPKLMKLCIQAVYQWEMIQDGDRLLLGLSGGKDSLSLLHLLLEIKRRHPVRFELEVCTIDPMTPSFDPSPLIPYVESLGLKYHYLREDIVARAASAGKGGKEVASLCSYCARMKRGKLYTCARNAKCNKLVLAQHLDDCAESFMMSVMHNGFLRTMQANYTNNAGDLAVIRPLIYCRERLMTEFAKSANLPVINENCPACFEEPKERARVKKLLSREESLFPNFFDNIRRSLIPLMHSDSTAILRSYLDETLARSNAGVPNRRKRQRDEDHDMADASPETQTSSNTNRGLQEATDDELLRELARRKADKYRLAGANKFVAHDDEEGPACALSNGCTIVD